MVVRHPNRQREAWSEEKTEAPRESYYIQPRRMGLGAVRLG